MKTRIHTITLPGTIATLVLLFCLYTPAKAAQQGSWYLGLKGGTYSPSGELRDDGFGTGSAVELSYGQFVTDNLSIEAGAGSYETTSTDIGHFQDEEEKLKIYPLTLTAKAVWSAPSLELAGGAGLGAYFVEGEYEATVSGDKDSDLSNDAVLGYHLMAEATFNMSRNFFFVVEDRFIQTQSMDMNYHIQGQDISRHTSLDGNLLVFSIGFRF
jgi:outer membrane protein W